MKIEKFDKLSVEDKSHILKSLIQKDMSSIDHAGIKSKNLLDIKAQLENEGFDFKAFSLSCMLLRSDIAFEGRGDLMSVYRFADDWHNLRDIYSIDYCSPKIRQMIEEYQI